MKKFISIMLCVCICLSSTVFCFADFTSTDSTNLSNIYRYMPTASQVTTLNNTLSTISTRVLNIYNALFNNDHNITYWVHAISTWMSPLYNAVSSIPTNHEEIKRLLGYVSSQDGVEVIDPYLAYQSKGVAQWVSELQGYDENLSKALTNYYLNESISNPLAQLNTHRQMVGADWYYTLPNFRSSDFTVDSNGYNINWRYGSPLGNIALIMRQFEIQMVTASSAFFRAFIVGYNSQQTYTTWNGDTLATSTFNPSSGISGIYTWLSKIQEPIARLSYVLASDQDIEARQAAADNQEAVVDNFIDSSGSGAASTSDIGSVSDLSSGFKDNISTDASVSGIWNIFNSDNFGWFSQETADQLDTTSSGQRTLRSSGSYATPLLDQQTEDILKYIGGDDND